MAELIADPALFVTTSSSSSFTLRWTPVDATTSMVAASTSFASALLSRAASPALETVEMPSVDDVDLAWRSR